MIKLVERFADVSEGSITIDGIDIRDLSLHALRAANSFHQKSLPVQRGMFEENVDYAADELKC